MKDYIPQEIFKSECTLCKWVNDLSPKVIKHAKCTNCRKYGGYKEFPSNDASAHIIGGLPHFIKSYNSKLTGPKHFFTPEMFTPIVFAFSHYEAMLRNLTDEIIRSYDHHIGRLGRFIIWQGTMTGKGRYDVGAAKKLFRHLVGKEFDSLLSREFKSFKEKMDKLWAIRNEAVHGGRVSVPNPDFNDELDEAIDFIIESITVFQELHNRFVADFKKNIPIRKILRLSEEADLGL